MVRGKWRIVVFCFGVILTAAVAVLAAYFGSMLSVATGYSAKILCSAVFLSQRTPETVISEDLEWFYFLRHRIDRSTKTASSDFWGFRRQQAYYREGLGCTLLNGVTRAELDRQAGGLPTNPSPGQPFTGGDRLNKATATTLEAAIKKAFTDESGEPPRRTRAVVVVHRGELIGEQYAPGFDQSTRLAGWSMTKSVLNALVGILVGRGELDLSQPAAVDAWSDPSDARGEITLNQLLQMSSGLEFQELYAPPSQATDMLFREHSAASFAAGRPLQVRPGSRWSYSSGTSNIVSQIVRRAVESSGEEYLSFPKRALFDRIGMQSAIIEPDPSGTFVASSFMYATARDWARFGQLFLQDGVWDGQRILPVGWVAYSVEPAPHASKGRYGAHWWLNSGDPPGSENRIWPELPADGFFASGFEGQTVLILPSHELVLVRLGLTHPPASFSIAELAHDVIDVLDQLPQSAVATGSSQ